MRTSPKMPPAVISCRSVLRAGAAVVALLPVSGLARPLVAAPAASAWTETGMDAMT